MPSETPASPQDTPEVLRRSPQPWLKPAAFAAAGLAVVVVAAGLVTRGLASEDLKTTASAAAVSTVELISPTAETSAEPLTLPASVEANDIAAIHPRVNGYIKAWNVDIGAHVKAGQVLADIDTPDLDQQLAQAKAALTTAAAKQGVAKISADRWSRLLSRNAVSQQETDEKAGGLAEANADVQAAKADVDRLLALEAFKRITAPFDGVVTARTAHVGALVTANAPNDPGLFTVADVHRLRIYVRVPQAYSADLKPGMEASLAVPEYPGRAFLAKLASTSEAVGAQSGALLAELQIDNADQVLKPGDYAQATFRLAPQSAGVLRLPASALMFRQKGMAVGVVDATGHARLRYVTMARDFGTTVEISAGLNAQDRVIDNPPDSLEDGEKVRVAQAAPARHG
ncbi:efflux RND transporter periplasmic adaptor subunit [Phenylobacterium sp.]|uniref:efflux RND transporter periplasmic adaptor subunit n=1 Tax=Phenylobacterium sp. TaxID=1871053 RepID=UPI0012286F8D|nr:efflux RND transporter periplasmic adaptor subunit [Phenylobacterium sp.]THD61336.1 MAG: efflux RND transporter periplasmic adaptor subunit [Phenylobacterium sp.]